MDRKFIRVEERQLICHRQAGYLQFIEYNYINIGNIYYIWRVRTRNMGLYCLLGRIK